MASEAAKESTPCEKFVHALLGKWSGTGKGEFPTMDTFTYGVESNFSRVAVQTKAYFVNTKTQSWPTGKRETNGMHYDNGFMKCAGANTIEWALTHNFVGTEVVKGTVDEQGESAIFPVSVLSNVSEVLGTKRHLQLVSHDRLLDTFYMRTKSVPEMTLHLKAELSRKQYYAQPTLANSGPCLNLHS